MATFYALGKVDLMILIEDSGNIRIIEKYLSYMFGFQHGSIYVSKDDAYDDNSVVKNSIYQDSVSNPNKVHWNVKAKRYRIARDNLIQCFQSTIFTPWIATSMANVALEAFIVKQEALNKEETVISSLDFPSSTFIDLRDSSNKDVFLPVNYDVNVFSSFLAPVSDVYLVEDMSLNLN
jgi:hypothetical protein